MSVSRLAWSKKQIRTDEQGAIDDPQGVDPPCCAACRGCDRSADASARHDACLERGCESIAFQEVDCRSQETLDEPMMKMASRQSLITRPSESRWCGCIDSDSWPSSLTGGGGKTCRSSNS